MADKLDEALGLPDDEPSKFQLTVLPQESVEEDFKFARSKMYSTIEVASTALDELKALAKTSQNARAYEVLANLARSIIDANKDLVALQATKRKILEEPGTGGPHTINNNLFMTTAEFQAHMDRLNGPGSEAK